MAGRVATKLRRCKACDNSRLSVATPPRCKIHRSTPVAKGEVISLSSSSPSESFDASFPKPGEVGLTLACKNE